MKASTRLSRCSALKAADWMMKATQCTVSTFHAESHTCAAKQSTIIAVLLQRFQELQATQTSCELRLQPYTTGRHPSQYVMVAQPKVICFCPATLQGVQDETFISNTSTKYCQGMH